MRIQAVKLYKNGFMTQPFAFGGEEGMEGFDPAVRYRSSLQNYVIDTGSEVILVDTGMPKEALDTAPDEKTMIYMGVRIKDYLSALAELGYRPEQVTKILLTHKHADHSGELRSFPGATIICSSEEAQAPELSGLSNVKPAAFRDGPYYNFPASERISEGVYLIPAKGHTAGNSIVIAETDGLFFLIHGDVTYTDEALYANKLSVVFEDAAAARETLDRVRAFVAEHPTVYLSTHTPLGYENLEVRRVVDLAQPPESLPVEEAFVKTASGKYVCGICGYVYDPEVGDPENGIPAGTPFAELPEDWRCPRCRQGKENFSAAAADPEPEKSTAEPDEEELIRAFQMMWGNYPEAVRLIRRDFHVIAGNKAYLAQGGQVDVQCNVGDPQYHRGCQAMNALKSGEARCIRSELNGLRTTSCWIPVEGAGDYYIHYTDGMNELFAQMKQNGKAQE